MREVNQVIRKRQRKAALEKLINYFDEYANDLAGKQTNSTAFPEAIYRKGMAAVKWLNSRAKSNAVLFNARSAIDAAAEHLMQPHISKTPLIGQRAHMIPCSA